MIKSKHPLYSVWQGIKKRCLNPNFPHYDAYGGRGIFVCESWEKSFQKFLDDMGERPDGGTIERIDNDGPYSPENCRWATRKEQMRNQRRTRKVVIGGVKYIAADLAEESGLKADTIIERAAAGLALAEVLSPERRIFYGGWRKAVAKRVANQRAATHCKHGHEWTPENTKLTPQGWKYCRLCGNAKMRRRNAAKRAAAAS